MRKLDPALWGGRYPWLVPALVFAFVLTLSLSLHSDHLAGFLRLPTDSYGYYQFLPGAFITHDWSDLPWGFRLESGQLVSMATIGVAWLQLPFFFLGHMAALALGSPADGYSAPYTVAQLLGVAVYLAFAFHLLQRSLARWHSPGIVLLVLAVLYFGTSLFYYSTWEPCMSHAYAFFLFAWLLDLTLRIAARISPSHVFELCVCVALLTLVRPFHAVAVVLPITYALPSWKGLVERAFALLRPLRWSVPAVLCALLLCAPQIAYWRSVTGQWYYSGYTAAGQGFDWSAPHLLDILFSHQNGWFVYAPFMLPAMYFLVRGAAHGAPGARAMLFVWGTSWYVYASWWAWWLGAAYGFRGFLDVLPWLALPLAWSFEQVAHARRWLRSGAIAAYACFLFLGIRMTLVYRCCWDGPDWTWTRLVAAWKEALWLS